MGKRLALASIIAIRSRVAFPNEEIAPILATKSGEWAVRWISHEQCCLFRPPQTLCFSHWGERITRVTGDEAQGTVEMWKWNDQSSRAWDKEKRKKKKTPEFPTGFKPMTFQTLVWRSIHLSYEQLTESEVIYYVHIWHASCILLGSPMFVSYCVVEERNMVNFNPQTYTQIHIPTMVQWGEGGWWMEPLPEVFDMLQYFETILPLVESLWSS